MKFSSMNLLDEITKPELADLLTAFQERTFPRQKIVYQPVIDDDFYISKKETSAVNNFIQENHVFIVKTGKLRMYLSYESKEFTIAILKPGDLYVSHSNTFIQTLEDSTLLLIDTPTFNKRMMAVPQFAQTIIQVLGRLLKNSFTIIDGLALRDVTARLARFLLESATQDKHSHTLSVHINITGEILAQQVAASRQTVSTLLTDFVRAGILVKEKRGVYHILEEERLREMLI